MARQEKSEHNTGKRRSRYAQKCAGPRMYGPGCGANKLTPERMRTIRTEQGTLRPGTYYATTVEMGIEDGK
jgi:hypothetical protein